MGYLGNTPGENFITFSKQVFTIVNSQTAYTLNFSVVDENELRLVINNVVQEPGTGKAYTASGTTLTLASALTNGTDEMYCVFLGKARETVTVPTITKDKLNLISNATAGIEIKGDGGSNDGYLQLNCSQNSHGVKIKSPPHSAGQSYTLTLPQSITNNTFLKTDGSGNLSFASAGGTNTPTFEARLASNMTGLFASTNTLVTFDTEKFDIGSCFNNTTSSTTLNGLTAPAHSFTPNVSGKYFVYGILRTDAATTFPNDAYVKIYKNGSQVEQQQNASSGSRYVTTIQRTVELNGTGDYIQLYGIAYGSTGLIFSGTTNGCYFGAYKIIE